MESKKYGFALLVASLVASGCVASELGAWEDARTEYHHCVAEKGRNGCEVERANMDRLERDYDRSARRAWGCEHSPDRCQNPPD